ncbi:helix-turn-helix domain-containing protein [Piscinibacter sp. XHJ-5]|uniref:helix-turn-helix domain-containing protein n=1 Tax=Piscinibacter sp. XHJ-5 TaxID=3037797 RepID=UPI0024530F67|nr:helix-turn-helix domain-containing protein [Piscinibacter sp. XHJ-5]
MLPLRKTQMLAFDPEVMAMALQDGVLEHVQLEPGVFRGQIAHTATPGSRVDWGRYGLSVLARGDTTRDMVTITLPLGGHGAWRVHGRDANVGDIVIFPECGELLVTLPPEAQWLSVQVPRCRLEAAELEPALCRGGCPRRAKGEIDAGLQATLASLAPVLAPHDSSAIAGDAEMQRAHDELLAALFCELARRGGSADASAALSPGERWRVVRRAEDYLDGRGDESVRIDDLCVAACTSLSRLERSFHEVFGVGPRRFLMLRRLAAVRRELLRADAGTSVTDVATRWGFFHLGRFSQEYRLHYGERPSQTLSQLRGVVPTPVHAA